MDTDTSANNTLLALLLALKESDTPLSKAEKETLLAVSEELAVDSSPETWHDLTQPSLFEMLKNNHSLYQRFQFVKSQLDALGEQIPVKLLRSEAELEQVIPLPKTKPQSFVIPVDEPSHQKSYEITNMVLSLTTQILKTPQPDETVKKLNRLDQLKQFLNSPILG